MTNDPTRSVVDADGPVLEPAVAWLKYLDPEYRDRAIRIDRDAHGYEVLLIDGLALKTLRNLVRHADVFSQSYRPGTLGNRGFSPEALAQLRPGIVFVSLSAFGHVGPWASRRGFDTVVQTVSGITARQGELFPGTQPGPQFYPVSAIDYLTGYLMAFGAMVALARRVREGGSWLVRISLAQTGRWLVGRGQVPEAELKDVPKEFTLAELERWSMTSDTPVGRLRHLGPVVRLSETPPRWARPSVPLGYHEPVWPARAE